MGAGLGDKGGLTPGAGVARGEPSLASRCGCGMWAQSRRRRGRGEPTDVARGEPSPGADVAGAFAWLCGRAV